MRINEPRARAPAAEAAPSELSRDQIRRLAGLIADGKAPWPTDLPAESTPGLRTEVRRQLRQRMVNLIATVVARRIHTRRCGHAQ